MRISIYAFGKWRVYNNFNGNYKLNKRLVDWIFQVKGKTIISVFIVI